MKDDRPYLTSTRCATCLRPFRIEERRLPDGGLKVTYTCEPCGRTEVITLSSADLEQWRESQSRRRP